MSNQTFYLDSGDRPMKQTQRNEILSQILDDEGYSVILDDHNWTCAKQMDRFIFNTHVIYFVNFVPPRYDYTTEKIGETSDNVMCFGKNKFLLNMTMLNAIRFINTQNSSPCTLMWYDGVMGFDTERSVDFGSSPAIDLYFMFENLMFGNAKLYLTINNSRKCANKQNFKIRGFFRRKVVVENYSIEKAKENNYYSSRQGKGCNMLEACYNILIK